MYTYKLVLCCIYAAVYGLDNPAEWISNQINSGKIFTLYDEERANAFLRSYGYKASQEEGIYSQDDRVANEGKIVKQNYSVSEEMDAEYLEAVEQGDMETAQRMVDEAAEKATGQKTAPPEQRYSLTPDTDIEEENIRNGKEALIQMHKMAEEAENPENDKETAVYATGEVYGSTGATAVTPTHTRRNGVDTTVSITSQEIGMATTQH